MFPDQLKSCIHNHQAQIIRCLTHAVASCLRSVIRALQHCLKTKDKLHEALSPEECNTLLKYFNDSCDQWAGNGECIAVLRELPLFMTGEWVGGVKPVIW